MAVDAAARCCHPNDGDWASGHDQLNHAVRRRTLLGHVLLLLYVIRHVVNPADRHSAGLLPVFLGPQHPV